MASIRALAGQVESMRALLSDVRAHAYAAEVTGQLLSEGRKPRYPVEFRSQFGEDASLWKLFGGRTEGYFIEVGAFDGYAFSVTYALECAGWDGLLIEAIPERAQACRERRKNSRVVHAALGRRGSSGSTTFTVVDDEHGGMSSYHTASPDHLALVAHTAKGTRTVEVPLTTIDDLLAQEPRRADVAVIDVEGGEVEVLEGFDLERHKPRVLMLEDNTRQEHSALGRYLRERPYRQVGWLEVNRIYVRLDEPEILSRAGFR